jgi:hypothetical protein
MNVRVLTSGVLPRHDAIEQSIRRAKQFEKLMRPNAALEASMRRAEQIEKLMRPNAALEAAMRHNEQLEKVMRPNAALEAAMRDTEQLARTMRPSAAFEASIDRAAQLADMMRPTRALEGSLRRAMEFADAMRPTRAFEESLRRTQQLADAARIGNALRQFIWQEEIATTPNFEDAKDDVGEPDKNEPELIISREFGPESLLASENKILIRGCAPSLLALRRLFSKRVDLGKITWRELEEIIAELLSRDGYDVELGRGTKDNGVDVLASKILPDIGLLRTVWQAKHLKPGNKVELKTIRELADIRDQEGATKGVIVTTGFLTSGALQRIKRDAYRLGKIEGPELEDWIRRSLNDAV